MSCNDRASNTPGGLVVEASVSSSAGSCRVTSTKWASHIVEVRNRTLLTYAITVHGECETGCVRYSTGLGTSSTWDDQLNIGPRPGKGGSHNRTLQTDLTCGCAAKNETVRTDLSIVV